MSSSQFSLLRHWLNILIGKLQGPYFGQHVWFRKFHPEDLPSAKKRYDEQTTRVFEVLNGILEGKEYLVGGKL